MSKAANLKTVLVGQLLVVHITKKMLKYQISALTSLDIVKDPTFNPTRAPIIAPKKGMRGLKMGPVGKNDWSGSPVADEEKRMASNVVCKSEKVTELEIVTALRRSLPIDSSQAIRKRTRAGKLGLCSSSFIINRIYY